MKYVISYAYDVPYYADFIVKARSKKAALKKAKEAFLSGRFNEVRGQRDDTTRNARVFVLKNADKFDEGSDSV